MAPQGLGYAIHTRRLELGLSQQEFARRLGPDVRAADVARLETFGNSKDLAPILQRLRFQLQEIASTLWVMEILVDEQDEPMKAKDG